MKFDEILEEIGGFGKFQKFVFALSCFTVLLEGFFMLNPVFLLGIPNHRCAILGYDNDTFEIQNDAHQILIDKYIPTSDEFDYNRCHVCAAANETYSNRTFISTVNCTMSRAVKCNRWVYDTSVFGNTFVTEVDLVCDKDIWVANAQMIFYGGMLVGSVASGIVADAYGRKPVVYVSGLIMVGSSIGLAWVRTYWLFCVIEFILGGSVVALFMSTYIIYIFDDYHTTVKDFQMFPYTFCTLVAIEITSTKKRVWPGYVSNFPSVAGLLILTAVAYWFRDWYKIQLYTSIPGVLLICYWWLMPESPRWLLTKGRANEAEAIIRKTARWNKTTVPDDFFDQNTLEDDKDVHSSFVKLLSTKTQFLQTIVIFFNWFVVSLAYFGLALYSNNLNGNLYINFGLSGLVEIPAYSLVIALDKVGRRRLYCATMVIGGISCLSTIFSIEYAPKGSEALAISLSIFGRLCVTAAHAVVYIHSAELFPTVVRNAGMCWAFVFAKLGSMVAPYIVVWGESYGGTLRQIVPLLIFGGASILSGLVSLILPETLNKNLTDTVQDEEKSKKSGVFDVLRSFKRHQNDVEESQDIELQTPSSIDSTKY